MFWIETVGLIAGASISGIGLMFRGAAAPNSQPDRLKQADTKGRQVDTEELSMASDHLSGRRPVMIACVGAVIACICGLRLFLRS